MLKTIQTRVAPQILAKVTRLFNGTAADILTELLQNARRAGATTVRIDTSHETSPDGCTATLRIDDDGRGIADPATFLALGKSDWDTATLAREDPAGMGVFSLAGRRVRVSSRTADNGMGWSAEVPAAAWASGAAAAVDGCVRRRGTTISVDVPHDWLDDMGKHVERAARYFPLAVVFNNERQKRADFLAGAVHVESFEGVRIGVFNAQGRLLVPDPTINFHGLTIRHELPHRFEIGRIKTWIARVDIDDCPALQLTLPTRKDLVDSPFLPRLAEAVEKALYHAIMQAPNHRLGFADWKRAVDLGITLPEAARGLASFVPATADSGLGRGYAAEQKTEDGLIIIGDYDAPYEQSLGRAIKVSNSNLGGLLVRGDPDLTGYRWYNDLPRVTTLHFVVAAGDRVITVGDDLEAKLDTDDQVVDAITAELTIVDRGGVAKQLTMTTDVLVLPNDDCWDLDNAPIAVVPAFGANAGADFEPLTPVVLASILDAAFFESSDDRNADSFDSQLRDWRDDSMRRAVTLLEGKDAANRLAIVEAFNRHIAWLLPQGHCLLLTAMNGEVHVSIAPPGDHTPATTA